VFLLVLAFTCAREIAIVQVFTEAAKFARTAVAANSYGSRPGVWGRSYTGSPKQFLLVLIPQNLLVLHKISYFL